jgi:uncharacterized protein
METAIATPTAPSSRAVSLALSVGVGALFAVGLVVSGMTDPAKVRGFLDITGAWDPSLAFVMMGAIGVHAPLAYFIAMRRAPVLAPAFSPLAKIVDARLVAGAAIFGIGWGIAGYCPGPAIVSLIGGSLAGVAFVGAMAVGMVLARRFGARGEAVASDTCS